ncbi:MAG: hypothetical protein ACPH5P_00075 [Akkermansiaceae bacterium]
MSNTSYRIVSVAEVSNLCKEMVDQGSVALTAEQLRVVRGGWAKANASTDMQGNPRPLTFEEDGKAGYHWSDHANKQDYKLVVEKLKTKTKVSVTAGRERCPF